jgi:cysteine synthase A
MKKIGIHGIQGNHGPKKEPQTMAAQANILSSIGNTPIIELCHVVPAGCARILVKLENQNPTGSMKDRMARAVVEGAVARGALIPGGIVVEYTGGSTGTSLAFVCAAMGYHLSIVTSDAFSREKRDHMRALGADVLELPSEGGRTTKELIQRMISRAKELSAAPNSFFADQFNNPDAASGYASMAREIWDQSDRNVDVFVQSVGTAQCITGVTEALRKRNIGVHIVAVEPCESPVLSGGAPGPHKIEGIGPGFIPPIWNDGLANEIIQISTGEAKDMARRLAKEEALFAGTSTGSNVLAAIQIAARLGSDHTVATVACDSGLKYLSTDLYAST